MKIKMSIVFILLLYCTASVFAEDWQYWSTWSAIHDISSKAQVSALTEAYFRGISDDYVYDEYITYSHKLEHGFGLFGQLYFESVKSSSNAWLGTRSAVAGLFYEKELYHIGRIKLEDRIFYRLNSPAEFDYHRPRLYFFRDIGQIKLTLSDEMRIDLTGERTDKFYRNRIYAMVSKKVSPSLLLGIGYLRQSDKNGGSWESFNGVQSLVSVIF
jgi:hypothetical protein